MARTRQQQGPTRIDWNNPITRGLLSCIDGNSNRNIVNSAGPTANTTTRDIGAAGVGIRFGASTYETFALNRSAITNQVTQFALLDYTVITGANSFIFGDVEASGAGFNAGLYTNTSNFFFFLKTSGSSSSITSATSANTGGPLAVYPSFRLCGRYDGANLGIYVNGKSDATPVGKTGNVDASAFSLNVNRWNNANPCAGLLQLGLVWARALSGAEITSISDNPWQIFAPSRRVWVQLGPAAGGGAVTGAASIAQSPQTLTGAGTVAVAGTLSKTPAAQTATTAVAVAIAGTLNKTQAAQTVTTAGSVAVSGTFNKTPAAQTLTASGTVASGVTGTASITPTAQTVTGSGAVPIAATATVTPSAQTATTSGAVQVAATATITPAAQTLTATGTVVSGVVGNATITPAAQTATASGTVPIAATATVTPAPQTLSSTAAVSGGAVTGTANIYVSAQTLVAAANIIVLGTATITPAPQTLLGLEAGTLPADIPASSRTLSQMTERLGSEWVATDPARLGLATARRSRPRLG
jgi:hypothetical protein